MVYQVPAKVVNSLPLPIPEPREEKVLYSLYEYQDGSNRWVRISDCSYGDMKTAAMVFSNRILEFPLHRQIRPITVEVKGANLRFNR